jgi:hypothetical protein
MASPIFTYHCLCSQFLLASTRQLDSLPHRKGEALDQALILSLPPLPGATSVGNGKQAAKSNDSPGDSYATLLNTTTDRKPVVIRRSDGFETRYQIHCGRCKLIVGYQLDHDQYGDASQTGRREDVCYLLPGSLLSTEETVPDTAQ